VKKAYALIYGSTLGTMEDVKKWATASSVVVTWRYELPNCFWLISENSAQEIHDDISKAFPSKSRRYIVTEIDDNRQGMLTPEGWYLLKNKVHKPK
jgi:hypothetical protein